MKTALYIIGTLLGVGVVIYIVKMFSGKTTPQTSQVKNTNSASALDPFYKLFGLQQTPRSTGQAQDNTGQLIAGAGSAFGSVVKSFQSLFGSTPQTTGVAGVGSPNVQIGNGLTYNPTDSQVVSTNIDSFDYSIFD